MTRSAAVGVDGDRLELYWIPLGAGATVVRHSGRVYERLAAAIDGRPRDDLYHSALIATTPEGRWTIEMTPIPRRPDESIRGVVAEGAVGLRVLAPLRIFQYEIRMWLGGEVPDLRHAVGGPVLVTGESELVQWVLRLVPTVPTPVWGRDELHAGEMWNSNSVVSWLLTRAGLINAAGAPPSGGRAPGWDAGVVVAMRNGGGQTTSVTPGSDDRGSTPLSRRPSP